MTNATISKAYNDSTILLFREDGWFNMTKAAKAFGKRVDNFWTSEGTQPYCKALEESLNLSELTEAKRGYNGGTWAHPKLAVFFARWLDTKFAVWCDAVIDDILRGHQALQMVNKAESAEAALPADVKEAATNWKVQMQEAMATLQKTVESQQVALNEAQALLKAFMLKQEGDAKNAEYMTINEYLKLVNLHCVDLTTKKKMREAAILYCQRRGLPIGSQPNKFQGKDSPIYVYPKHALNHAFDVAYSFNDESAVAF